jgi:hypothetical protein
VCFWFGLWFGVCLVVVVGAFFHVGCDWLGSVVARRRLSEPISMLAELLQETAQAPSQPSRKRLRPSCVFSFFSAMRR